jgi:hypothetical protein
MKKDAMNNPYLNNNSEVFVDDSLERVEKRCFFLMCGKNFQEPLLSIDLSANVFNDPSSKMKILLVVSLN